MGVWLVDRLKSGCKCTLSGSINAGKAGGIKLANVRLLSRVSVCACVWVYCIASAGVKTPIPRI